MIERQHLQQEQAVRHQTTEKQINYTAKIWQIQKWGFRTSEKLSTYIDVYVLD